MELFRIPFFLCFGFCCCCFDCVCLCRILNFEGSVLAYAGQLDKEGKVAAAIASNVWQMYEEGGKTALGDDDLEYIIIECENGRICITKVSKLLLCMYSDRSVECGMLKAKAEKLVSYLEPDLETIMTTSTV
eukprot:Nk52_evm13s310 gene=Nk52_evmTU13s310